VIDVARRVSCSVLLSGERSTDHAEFCYSVATQLLDTPLSASSSPESSALPLITTLYETALGAFSRALPPTHNTLGVTRNNLAEVYRKCGRYNEALELYETVLAIMEGRSPSTSTAGPASSEVDSKQGSAAPATATSGPAPAAPKVDPYAHSVVLGNIGLTLQANQRYAEARAYFERARVIREDLVAKRSHDRQLYAP
jgi:tetratricopeptide (TPR) repeat protein